MISGIGVLNYSVNWIIQTRGDQWHIHFIILILDSGTIFEALDVTGSELKCIFLQERWVSMDAALEKVLLDVAQNFCRSNQGLPSQVVMNMVL